LSSKEQLPDEEIDEEGFELDDFLYGNAFENIADFLCCLDDDDIFTFSRTRLPRPGLTGGWVVGK
jgi:hypothetical protein